MNKYKKLITNTAVLALGTLGSKILVFLLMPLYTRLLSSSEYSTADIISQTANLLIPLISLGMYEAVFRFAMDKNEKSERVLTTGLYTTLAGGAVFALFLPLLCKIEYFNGYFPLVFLYVVCASIHYLVSRYTRAIGQNTLFAVQGMLSTALNIGFNIIFLVGFDMGVTGYVLSVIVADMLTSLFLFFKLGLWKRLHPSNFSKAVLGAMLKYSVPLIPTTVFWWVTNVSDRYIIRAVIGDSVNGLYAAAFKIPTILLLLSSVFTEAWQFSAVVEKDGSNKKEHAEFFGVVFNSFQGMLFMSAAGLIAFSKVFAVVLFAQSYFEAWRYMPLLIMATVYSSLVTFMGSVYLVDKKSIHSFATALIGAVVNVVLNVILIGPYGANGAAFATFICYLVVYIIRAVTARKMIPFDQHPLKVCVNTLILGVQTVFLILELPFAYAVQAISVILIFVLNARPILGGVMKILKRRKG
ncbi:MAG: polysaccharide biosynthesis C-terminal domain-containing protein [Clostridia bacterium]|nr:polysaccharide biosynthesis C-terminal domain-containing protein [Clostridia bacterium]